MLQGKTVFITGASSGIGQACAEQFAASGARLILAARRGDRLEALALNLQDKYRTDSLVLTMDVRQAQDVQAKIAALPQGFENIDCLVNNAGLALGTDPFQIGNIENWEIMIDTNIKGLLYISRAVLPKMIEQNTGHIINIGSVAGHSYYAGGNVYCATKHAVKALTHCLRIDLAGTPIRITEIDPGAVKTEFSEVRWKDKARADDFYAGFTPLLPDDIARSVLFAAIQPAHVNITEIMLMATEQNAPSMITPLEQK